MTSKIIPSDSYIRFLSPPSPSPAPENIKNILPNYRITYSLGSGGFADVYASTDVSGRDVAIKIPQMKFDATIDSSVYDKFEKEISIWKNLKHPNIVGLYSTIDQPFPHIIMEMMDGGSLESLIKRHELTIGEAIHIMLQVLEGLSYAHRMATIHRDLKPENILFTSNGEAKITDWGIGKLLSSTEMTKTIGIKGTLYYCAPEQFDKKKYGTVDWKTDIFQIGIVFYEMLTGVNPFAGEAMAEVVGKVLTHEVEPPSSLNNDVPPELDEIVMGALEKEKSDRWRTDVMLHELNRLLMKELRIGKQFDFSNIQGPSLVHNIKRTEQLLLKQPIRNNQKITLESSTTTQSNESPHPINIKAKMRMSGHTHLLKKYRRRWKQWIICLSSISLTILIISIYDNLRKYPYLKDDFYGIWLGITSIFILIGISVSIYYRGKIIKLKSD